MASRQDASSCHQFYRYAHTSSVQMLTLGVSVITVSVMATFQDIVDHFGGTHESLAKELGLTREAVTMWRGEIPEAYAYQIQVLSQDKFTVEDMPVRYRKRKRRAA